MVVQREKTVPWTTHRTVGRGPPSPKEEVLSVPHRTLAQPAENRPHSATARPFDSHKAPTQTMSTQTKKATSIVDVATGNKDFSTLVKALKAGDLVDTLKGKGPFTVFAPSNAAFEKLPKGTLDDLLKPANKEKLQKILKRHVVKGRQMSSAVAKESKISPMSGSSLQIQAKGDRVRIGDATIQQADLEAENGVVHVIDRVLLP